jgi:hypothetical protein
MPGTGRGPRDRPPFDGAIRIMDEIEPNLRTRR